MAGCLVQFMKSGNPNAKGFNYFQGASKLALSMAPFGRTDANADLLLSK